MLVEEDGEDPVSAIVAFCEASFSFDLKREDIDRAHRLGAAVPGKNRVLIVKFGRYDAKRALLDRPSNLNGTGVSIKGDLTVERLEVVKKVASRLGPK